MNKKLRPLLLLVALAVLLSAAGLCYRHLSVSGAPSLSVSTMQTQTSDAGASGDDTSLSASTKTPAAAASPSGEDAAAKTESPDLAADTADSADPAIQAAPDFTVEADGGVPVRLSGFRGQPVILNFWASWCPPCRAEMPEFESAFEEYGGQIAFVMVNLTDGQRETLQTAKEFIAEQGYLFPVYFDTQSEAAYAYYVTGIPATYFLNADGTLAAYQVGALTGAQLAEGIRLLLE